MAAADLDPGRPFTDDDTPAEAEHAPDGGTVHLPALPSVTTVDIAAPIGLPSPNEWVALSGLAEQLARSGLVPKALRGKPDDVMLVLLTGRDLAIAPTTAVNKIHVIEGKPTLSAELMCALVNRQPGMRIWPDPANDDKVAVAHALRDGVEMRFRFTIGDATRAKLTRKEIWAGYPQFMLWARAVSGLCRMAFPDVLAGVSYTPEEMGAAVDPATGEVIDVSSTDYRPVGKPPPVEVDPDEAAREAGWTSADEANDAAAAMRAYAESIDPAARRRTTRWAKAHRLTVHTRDGHDRIRAAAEWFEAHRAGQDTEPFDVQGEEELVDAAAVEAYERHLAGPDDGPPVSPAPDEPGPEPSSAAPEPEPTDAQALAAAGAGAAHESPHAGPLGAMEREERRLLVLADPDTPPPGEDPAAWAEWVDEVRTMTPPELNAALAAASQEVRGRRPEKEARLIATAVL
jgi:hypothetical protein